MRVNLETITVTDAEALAGKTVVVTFVVAKPAYTWGEGKALRTIVGPKDSAMHPERSVNLKGSRLPDADLGATVTVVGTLRVIRHPAATVGTTTSYGFTEIRIAE